ncbi:heavy metal-associated isoprenylated plant protein 39-like [Chenopodium quinoa]|uniref:heavy metal-associated isoprenylated plant protein 39-like n=1 Tax=Chenopodium quinoa TaxID=63459 RepID=UPI000B76E7ED|nr:heavy metal-associated isoprenylated plant protein 39-like [Chenopodium quinoa]
MIAHDNATLLSSYFTTFILSSITLPTLYNLRLAKMQKLVLQLDVHNDLNCKQKAINLVSSILGIDSISMDMKEKKLTVVGEMDPVDVMKKLRKKYSAKIISVGPAKEPEKPKEVTKKPVKPKVVVPVVDYVNAMHAHNTYYTPYTDPCYSRYKGYTRSVEEDPTGCVIC